MPVKKVNKKKKQAAAKREEDLTPAAKVLATAYANLGFTERNSALLAGGAAGVISAPVHTVRRSGMFVIDAVKLLAGHIAGIGEDVAQTFRKTTNSAVLYFSGEETAKQFVEAAVLSNDTKLLKQTGISKEDIAKVAAKALKGDVKVAMDAAGALGGLVNLKAVEGATVS